MLIDKKNFFSNSVAQLDQPWARATTLAEKKICACFVVILHKNTDTTIKITSSFTELCDILIEM